MKIKLDTSRHKSWREWKQWTEAEPFYVNPRGVLVHRVKSVGTYMREGKPSHHAVHYWCGNCNCFPIGEEKDRLVSEPPKGKLVCTFCEFAATNRGRQRSTDKIVGRHVHKGRCVAIRTCCGDEN